MVIDLKGKRALVTGAASGIGNAIAEVFAQAGAHVVLLDLQHDAASKAAAAIAEKTGTACIAVAADVSDEASVSAAFA